MTTARRWRLVVLVLWGMGAGIAVAFAIALSGDRFVHDAHAYWAADPATAYTIPEGEMDALFYAPPIVIAMAPWGVIPWPAFAYAWSLLIAVAISAMAGPFTLPLIVTPPIASEISLGNIHAFIGVLVIAGFRWPAAWALILLTKVTPGVGLLWFVFRREWRSLAVTLAATAVLVLPTLVFAGDLWARWVEALVANRDPKAASDAVLPLALPIRLAVATVVLWWGARRDARWVVPIAVTLGLPILWSHGLAILLASLYLALGDRVWRAVGPREVPPGG